jgi:hypothetical protein
MMVSCKFPCLHISQTLSIRLQIYTWRKSRLIQFHLEGEKRKEFYKKVEINTNSFLFSYRLLTNAVDLGHAVTTV